MSLSLFLSSWILANALKPDLGISQIAIFIVAIWFWVYDVSTLGRKLK